MIRALSLVTCLVFASRLSAQTGLLIVAHGADSSWDARVVNVVRQVRWSGPVRVAFLMGADAGTSSLAGQAQALVAAGAKRVAVVPLMVSTWGAHVRQIEGAVATGVAGPMDGMPGMVAGTLPAVPTRVTNAIDSASELGTALGRAWRLLPPSDRKRPLVLVAHGPDTDAEAVRWVANITAATRQLASDLPDHAVHVGLLRDDAPPAMRAAAVSGIRDTIAALAHQSHDSVMVMTVLISSGSINASVVPADLTGMPMHYSGSALAPDPALARWIERVAADIKW